MAKKQNTETDADNQINLPLEGEFIPTDEVAGEEMLDTFKRAKDRLTKEATLKKPRKKATRKKSTTKKKKARTTGKELTDFAILAIKKPGQHADQSVSPLGVLRRGLVLKVTVTKKAWIYRTKKNGKAIRLVMGEYPDLGIALARDWFDLLKIADDPVSKLSELRGDGEVSDEAIATLSNKDLLKLSMKDLVAIGHTLTVKQLVLLFITKYGKPNKRKSSWLEDERMFYLDLLPDYGDTLAYKLTSDDVADMLEKVLERGSPRIAQKLLVATKTMYNWSMGKVRRRAKAVPKKKVSMVQRKIKILPIDANPCDGVEVPQYEHRSCYLDEETLPAFLQNLPALPTRDDVKDLLTLQLQTISRVTEVGGLPWSEINMRSKVWNLPAERSKNGQAHRVMLSTQSMALLKRRKTDSESDFIFPTNSVRGNLTKSVVAAQIAQNREALGVPDAFTSHSLRHTALTWLAGHEGEGATSSIRNRLSNHKENTATDMDARYTHHKFDDEAREWTQKWCDYLESLS